MAETPALPPEPASSPKKICEKCRNEYLAEQFDHGVEGQDCVCTRCLKVMGYKVKAKS